MGSGSGVTNSLGVGLVVGLGANNLSGVTFGVALLFGSDFGNFYLLYDNRIAKTLYLLLCGQKDKITLSALVVLINFAMSGIT
jgi:hypothetical protein